MPTRLKPSRQLSALLPGAAVIVLTWLAYIPALRGGFVWDDDAYVTANRTLRSLAGLAQIWLEPQATPQYYPLVFSSFWIEHRLWGLDPFGYHAVNVALHALTAVLLGRFLTILAIPSAWGAAAIFALHPVQVESVAWISERKNVLSGFFYMVSALLCWQAVFLRDQAGGSRRLASARYGAALACFVAALLSKTVTCSLPAALLLLVWWRDGRITRRDVLALLPFFVIGLGLALVTIGLEQSHVGAVGADWELSFIDRCLIAGRALWFYAATLVWPYPLTFIYPRWIIDAAAWWQYLYPVAAVAVFAGLAMHRRFGRGPLTAVCFFAGTLFPALGFIDVFPMRYSFVADHFQYLACAGLIVLAVAVATRSSSAAPSVARAAFAVVVMLCFVLTVRQGSVYADVETLWRDTLAKNPTAWMAHNNLGLLLFERGDAPGALSQFEAALRIKSDDAYAHNNIGNVLAREGRLDEALSHFRTAARFEPDNAAAHGNIGNVLAARGELDAAIAELSEAIRIDPEYADAHSNLGNVFALRGRRDDAIAHYRAALDSDPEFAAAHHNLGILLLQSGAVDEAISHWRAAIALNPRGVDAHTSLALVLAERGQFDEAARHLEAVLRIQPDNVAVREKLESLRASTR